MLNEVKLHGAQRVDLPDFQRIFQFNREEHAQTLKQVITETGVVVEGFNISAGAGLVAQLDRNSARVAIRQDGTLYVNDVISALPLDITLNDDDINYLELEILESDVDAQNRVFWNVDEEQEFINEVDTKRELVGTVYVVTGGYTGGDRIPLYRFTTASGAITTIQDDRPRLYSPSRRSAFSWPVPKDDSTISDGMALYDAIADQLRAIIGKTYWYEDPTASLEDLYALLDEPVYEEEYEVPSGGHVAGDRIQLPLDGITSDKQYAVPGGRELKVALNGVKLRIGRDYLEYSDGTHPTVPTLITHIELIKDIPGGTVRGKPRNLFMFWKNNSGGAVINYQVQNQVAIQDEGSSIMTQARTLNFIGGNVQVVQNGAYQADIIISGSGSNSFVDTKFNNTGTAIPAFTPVILLASDVTNIEETDVQTANKHFFFGITLEEIADGASGLVQWAGKVANAADSRGWSKVGFVWLGENPGELIEGDTIPGHAYDKVLVGQISDKDIILNKQFFL